MGARITRRVRRVGVGSPARRLFNRHSGGMRQGFFVAPRSG
nr:MAG TPA: hypothetical protein [Caudoviricetes sp.]